MAGEAINEVQIVFTAVDNATQASENISSTISGNFTYVGETINQNLGAATQGAIANTTKETGKLADKITKATGPTNLMGKSINRLVRMFNPFNIGIGLVIGGVTALGKELYDLATGSMNKIHESMRQAIKDSEDLNASISKVMLTDLERAEGLSSYELKKKKLGAVLTELQRQKIAVEEKIRDSEQSIFSNEAKLKWDSNRLQGLFAEDEEWQNINKQIDATVTKIEEVKRQQEALAMHEATAEEATPGGVTIKAKKLTSEEKKAGKPTKLQLGLVDEMLIRGESALKGLWDRTLAYQKEIQDEAAHGQVDSFNAWFDSEMKKATIQEQNDKDMAAKRIAVEKYVGDELDKIANENAERAATVSKNVEQTERESAQNRMEVIEGLGGAALTLANMGGRIASSVAKTEKAKAKAEATTAVIIASIQAALEVARAISSYPDFVGMAAHAAGAAAYIAAAVLAAKYGGGTPAVSTAKGAGGGGGREAFGPPSSGDETKATTIIIQGHVFSPEGGADFVRRAMEASEDQTNPGRTRKDVR